MTLGVGPGGAPAGGMGAGAGGAWRSATGSARGQSTLTSWLHLLTLNGSSHGRADDGGEVDDDRVELHCGRRRPVGWMLITRDVDSISQQER